MPRVFPALWVHFDTALEPARMCSGWRWAHIFPPTVEDLAMPAGRRTAIHVPLSRKERRQLRDLFLTHPVEHELLQRAEVVLLRADGATLTQCAREVGLSRVRVYKWLRRWLAEGLVGLWSQPSGRRAHHD